MIRLASLITTAISLLCSPALVAQPFELSLRLRNDSAAVLPAAQICGLTPLALDAQAFDWQISGSRTLQQGDRQYCLTHDVLGPYQSQQLALHWQPTTPLKHDSWMPAAPFDLAVDASAQLLALADSFAGYPEREKVERIFAWMLDNIEFSGIRRGIEGAEHALLVGKGDCTEHMLLAGELLERNGITIRRVLGGALPKDQRRITAAMLHNWIEYLDNGTWLVFDSSRRLLGAPKKERYVALLFYQSSQQLTQEAFTTDLPQLKLFLQ